jgi:threonine synthase
MTLYLFTAENFVTRVQHADHPQVVHFGMRDATFVEAFNYAATYAAEHKLVSERGFFNPGRREGLKMAFFEASDQALGPIDWYVQAVSSAMGVYGTYKGAKELHAIGHIDRLPKLLCAQQTSCAPMVRAYEEGGEAILPHHVVARPEGIAEAILRGDPSRVYPYVKGIVVESGGDFVAVTEAEIRDARRMTEELEGISPCFSASTAVAGLIKKVRNGTFPRNESVMVNLTGGDRPRTPHAPSVRWLRRDATRWVEED